MIEYQNVTIIPAKEYRDRIEQAEPRLAILLIYPETSQMSLVKYMNILEGSYECVTIPVVDSEAPLVDALVLPRLRLFHRGVLVRDDVLDKSDPASVEDLMRELK
jgi:hypothetical protein